MVEVTSIVSMLDTTLRFTNQYKSSPAKAFFVMALDWGT